MNVTIEDMPQLRVATVHPWVPTTVSPKRSSDSVPSPAQPACSEKAR
jgi:hypothetical protein